MGNEQSASEELTQTENIPEKHENGSVKGLSEISAVGAEIPLEKNGGPLLLSLATEPNGTSQVKDEGDGEGGGQREEKREEEGEEERDAPVMDEIPEKAVKQEEVKKSKEGKGSRFGKLFKIKSHQKSVPQEESSGESPAGVSPPEAEPQQDTSHLKAEPEALPQPESASASAQPTPEEEPAPETHDGNAPPEEQQEEEGEPEENPVMNFFKTLVTPTKPAKSSAAPDTTKDQSEKENQPAAASTVVQVSEPPAAPKGMSVPPPPPPEPPKMETKGETSAKAAKTAPKEEPKAAVKEAEPSKGKSAKDAFGKFFRAKANKELPQPEAVVQVQPDVEVQEAAAVVEAEPVVEIQQTLEEEPQPVAEEEKVDPSKTGTLEAAPKPEPPAPVQEKKPASKSGFMSMFKSKAADPKKASPEVPAAAEPAPPVKTKEEAKPAAKTSETTAESKAAVTAAQTGDDAPSAPKKLEKRNSIQLFFKILSQKRNSTDAGIQTDPLAGPAAAEKSK